MTRGAVTPRVESDARDRSFSLALSWRASLVLLGACALAAGMAIIDSYPVGVFHDDSMYVILARSLATGQGYRYLNLPGAPVATHFPPGYPALLALVWRVMPSFPANVVVFKAMNAVFLCASALLVAQLVRDRLGSERWAFGVGIVSAVSVPLLVLATMVLSEPLFLALLLAVLVCAERIVARPAASRQALTLGVCIGVLALVRSHGIVALPAVALPLLVHRRWRDTALMAAGTLAVVLPWQLWSARHADALPAPLLGNYGSYAGWWIRGFREMGPAMIPATLAKTVPETAAMLAALFSPIRGAAAHVVTLLALGGLFTTGALALRTRAPVTLLFLAGYSAIVLVWPFPPSRFFWGVWPLLLLLLAAAGWSNAPANRVRHSLARLSVAAMLAWVAVGFGAYEVRAVRGSWWASISRAAVRRIEPAIMWTLANTAPEDVIAADDEGAVFLYTGRRAVPVAAFTTGHYLLNRSAAVEASEGLVPLLETFPLRAVLVGSSKTFDAAQYLASQPRPMLSLREQFSGGAAFTVLSR